MGTRIPRATYRLQLSHMFRFADVLALVDYFEQLGVSELYLSPILKAVPGSAHGYDVTDPQQLNPELGSEEDFASLARALRSRGMGIILDVVPNHMCIKSPANRFFADVLENGPSSRFAPYFDIDWHPPKTDLAAKVLLPFLGDQYGRVLEAGEIRVAYQEGSFFASYYDLELPVAPRSWPHLLEPVLTMLRTELSSDANEVLELESIVTALAHLPGRTDLDLPKVRERYREKEIIKRRLMTLTKHSPRALAAIERSLLDLNGQRGDPRSFDRLEMLLEDQGYRLCYWRVAADEINYRRFFDINELAAIRVEAPGVFASVHELIFKLVKAGHITGLRVDHIDGLLDPAKYLAELGEGFRDAQRGARASGAASDAGIPPCYLVVEKILDVKERLPSWPIHGTTGYEFLNTVGGLFLDPEGLAAITDVHASFTGLRQRFADVLYESRKLVMQVAMSAELTVLSRKLDRISEQHRATRDFTLISLSAALAELIACFPVYRTYIRPEDGYVSEDDRRHISTAIEAARRRNPATDGSLFDFLASLLFLVAPPGLSPNELADRSDFVRRLQQLTGPVMAKGLEDTACYRFVPLAAQNEVGGHPGRSAVSPADFHHFNLAQATGFPHSLTATSTHDTKRGEDVRARLAVLSECPQDFAAAVNRWRDQNASHREVLAGSEAPDASDEYLLYQTLLGAWPADGFTHFPSFVVRVQQYMEKALREAKVHTSWISPKVDYERAMHRFIEAILDPQRSPTFLADLQDFHRRIAPAGYYNSLSQVVLKIASPGVPDFYQGCELWNLSLVDPDNRRPVDFEQRRHLLTDLGRERTADPATLAERLLRTPEDARVKMFVTQRGLLFRKAHHEAFTSGRYIPLEVIGSKQSHVLALARALEDRVALAVVGRHYLRLHSGDGLPIGSDVWGDTKLVVPRSLGTLVLQEALTDRTLFAEETSEGLVLNVGDVLARLPVALVGGAA